MSFFKKIFSLFDIDNIKPREVTNPEDKALSKRYVELAKTKIMMKDYKSSLEILDKAIDLDSSNCFAYIERSKVKAVLEDYKGAQKDKRIAQLLFTNLDEGLNSNEKAGEEYDAGTGIQDQYPDVLPAGSDRRWPGYHHDQRES